MPLDFFAQSLHVTSGKKIAQAAVLRRHDFCIAFIADLMAKNYEHVAGQSLPQDLHDFISRHPADFPMETEIGLADLDPFQALGRQFHRGDDTVKVRKQAWVRLVNGRCGGERYLLKGNPRFTNLVDAAIIKTRNVRTPVRMLSTMPCDSRIFRASRSGTRLMLKVGQFCFIKALPRLQRSGGNPRDNGIRCLFRKARHPGHANGGGNDKGNDSTLLMRSF